MFVKNYSAQLLKPNVYMLSKYKQQNKNIEKQYSLQLTFF